MCGNHVYVYMRDNLPGGSPPRVREPLSSAALVLYSLRITPACAGTTTGWKNITKPSQDHPRVCGNHEVSTAST